jgi:hypothetical protein
LIKQSQAETTYGKFRRRSGTSEFVGTQLGRRRGGGEGALECSKVCAGQVGNRDIGKIRPPPAADVVARNSFSSIGTDIRCWPANSSEPPGLAVGTACSDPVDGRSAWNAERIGVPLAVISQ